MDRAPVEKKCAFCGKTFITKDMAYNALYCSDECKKAAKKQYMKSYKEEREKKSFKGVSQDNKEIAAIALAAFNQGLSYGQYVGKQLLQEAKKNSAEDIHK